jgi:pimeloyl-ACP methyl ester carboxylesterase
VAELRIESSGVTLAGDEAGEGTPVVLLHGLTATRRYVVMGSRSLERSGHRVIAYDARGHGASSPAPDPDAYDYDDLVEDLRAVLDDRGIDRAVLAGASMGAHTALRLALDAPERVAGLVIATPAFDPGAPREAGLARWDALSEGLRTGGVDGFVEAYGDPGVPEQWKETIDKVLRQRIAAHEHPEAVADALRAVPRSRPFESWDELGEIAVPVAVVASRDEADPGHPYAIGEAYAERIPGAKLLSEEPGSSPLAWQGGQLSKVISELAERAGAAGP